MKGTHTGRNNTRSRQRWLIAALLAVYEIVITRVGHTPAAAD